MSYYVTITDTTTGRMQILTESGEWTGGFIWTDGNFKCDCNRHILYEDAKGTPGEDIEDMSCNIGPNRYLLHIVDEAGKVLYTETP